MAVNGSIIRATGRIAPIGSLVVSQPSQYTNALSFTVTTVGATFPANGITVNLDGNDISSNLTITGSSAVKNVVYPSLQQNAIHAAIISATNSLGHGITVTIHFDT